MQKAFKDIIERLVLESSSCKVYKLIKPNKEDVAEFNAFKKAIKIVNQVAEEYSHRNTDLVIDSSHRIESLDDVIARLQYKTDNIKAKLEPSYFTECIDYLKSLPKCDDGWIPCSTKLPKEDKLVLCQGKTELFVGCIDSFDNKWRDTNYHHRTNIVAWRNLPRPYVKGE